MGTIGLSMGRCAQVLMVEDNPGDVRLTLEVFKDSNFENNTSVVEDGVEALAFLRKEGIYSIAPNPDIILLDLNLPRVDGRELLCEIKGDPVLKEIPVVVLSDSKAAHDIIEVYNKHAVCYLTKPVDFQQFIKVVQKIDGFGSFAT